MRTTRDKQRSRSKRKRIHRRYTIGFWTIYLVGLGAVALIFYLAATGVLGEIPSFAQIENPKSNLASELYSSDGVLLGKYYYQNRSAVGFDQLSPQLVHALIATEDKRFYQHAGIDFRGTMRAALFLGTHGGGSTITQQLAKNLYTGPPARNRLERLREKFIEWVTAVKLEKYYTKREIIAMYFNTYDFLYQAVGIKSAARIYFNTTPDSLKTAEAATLVGMAKNPYLYNPKKFPKKALARRNIVLKQMKKNGYLTAVQYDSLKTTPLQLWSNEAMTQHKAGIAPYFRAYIRKRATQILRKISKPNGEKYSLYRDGLRIYTTLDSRMQMHAERAVAERLTNLQADFDEMQQDNETAPFYGLTDAAIKGIMKRAVQRSASYQVMKDSGATDLAIQRAFETPTRMKVFSWKGEIDTVMTPMDSIRYYKSFLQAGLLSIDPHNGFIKAWVGGNNFKYFQFDHVKTGVRQIGSTFKPFVYATAIDQLKYSPCYRLPNTKITIGDWTPQNSGDQYGGMLSLKEALAKSVNVVTARLIDETGFKAVRRLAYNMGIVHDIPKDYTIALGTADLSLYEMTEAFTTFANKGIHNQPLAILRIEDKNGHTIYEARPQTREVMSEETAYVMTDLLEGVTQHGTGTRLRYLYKLDNPIAGKTGTTQNMSDGWFIGFVPNLVTGVWVGNADRSAHFESVSLGQGANTALPIWALYMKALYADPKLAISRGDFDKPENGISIELDCEKYDAEKPPTAGRRKISEDF
ncbi:MAG: transglycosylase domain-containing protein [Flavobacteriales bacterium]